MTSDISGPARTAYQERALEYLVAPNRTIPRKVVYLGDGLLALAPPRECAVIVYDLDAWQGDQEEYERQGGFAEPIIQLGVLRPPQAFNQLVQQQYSLLRRYTQAALLKK